MELAMVDNQKSRSPLHPPQPEKPKVNIDTELVAWIKRNRATTSLDPRHKDRTFIDESGICRYEDNWLPASTSAEYNRIHKTGCVEKSIGFLYESTTDAKNDGEIRFLMDWKLLWNHLETDNVDEIAKQLPMFKLFVDFYFHQKTSIFVLVLCLYLIVSQTLIETLIPAVPKQYIAVGDIYYFCEAAVYLSFRYMFKGSLFGDNIPVDPNKALREESEEFSGNDDESNSKNKEFKHTIHWSSTLRRLVIHSLQEIKTLTLQCFGCQWSTKRSSTTYYELMNMSLKFLIRLDGANLKKINFDRPSYRIALLMILFVYPFYIYFGVFCPRISYYTVCPGPNKFYEPGATAICEYYTFYLITTGYTFLTWALNVLFASGVLVGLVALAYGCEIAYQLTHAWIHRFKGLHRVEAPDDEGEEEESAKDHAEHDEMAKEHSRRHLSEIIKQSNDYESVESSRHHNIIRRGSGVNGVPASITASLALRQLPQPPTALNREAQLRDMVPLIGIDAREHYLFMREYMSQAGKVWSSGFVGMVAVFILVTVVYIYYRQSFLKTALYRMIIGIMIKFIILIVYPIFSIAYANSFVYELKELFNIAAEEEYSVIGGKEKWLSLLSAAPAVWTVFGFWITYDKLFAVLWALLSAAAAIGITVITAKV